MSQQNLQTKMKVDNLTIEEVIDDIFLEELYELGWIER